mmetsp:Transcript_12616/g.20420  ORF Transcript_12616/g.20420 Transcript_12616/m.20420 type:complete len:207 (+) Transcript_12616:259-879(+)
MSVRKSRRGAWIYISSGTPGACPYKGCISRGAAIGSTARLLPGSLLPPAVRTETTKRNREKLHPISAFIVSSDSINIIRFEVALIGEATARSLAFVKMSSRSFVVLWLLARIFAVGSRRIRAESSTSRWSWSWRCSRAYPLQCCQSWRGRRHPLRAPICRRKAPSFVEHPTAACGPSHPWSKPESPSPFLCQSRSRIPFCRCTRTD